MDRWMKTILSLAVIGASFYIILARPEDAAAREFAFGTIGLILGYWLRDSRDPVRDR